MRRMRKEFILASEVREKEQSIIIIFLSLMITMYIFWGRVNGETAGGRGDG